MLIISCHKDSENNILIGTRSPETPEVKPNILPYLPNSIKYVRSYITSKSGTYNANGLTQSSIPGQWFVNVTIDSTAITPIWYSTIVKDSLVGFYDFDISNPSLATFNPDTDGAFNISTYKDGKLHASIPINAYNTHFKGKVTHTIRDTLLMVSDTTKEKELLVHSGFITAATAASLRFESPQGFIRYNDPDQGENCSPVIRIKVWAIKLGLPVSAYTNNNGYFRIPTGFLFGTLVGTEAVNREIAVKPLSIHDELGVLTSINEWIFGPKYTDRWYRRRDLDNIDICFREHNKYRWWAIIITASSLNRNYMAQDGFLLTDKLTSYAIWKNRGSVAMSCPMFGESSGTVDILDFLQIIIPDLPHIEINMESHLMGFLPDLIFQTTFANDTNHYTSRTFHTLFHEFGHYTHYKQVGKVWWTDLIQAETTQPAGCGSYPAPNTQAGDIAQLAESWAEFMGDRHACRYYDPTRGHKRMFNGVIRPFIETRADGTTFNNQDGERFNNCSYHAYGIFFDLTDQPSLQADEAFDNIGGFTFPQLYHLLSLKDRSLCQFLDNRISPICNQNGTWGQLFQMVDHITFDDGSNDGHFLNCWR